MFRPIGSAELIELLLRVCQEDARQRPARLSLGEEEVNAERRDIVPRGGGERGLELVLPREGEEESGAGGRARLARELRPDEPLQQRQGLERAQEGVRGKIWWRFGQEISALASISSLICTQRSNESESN